MLKPEKQGELPIYEQHFISRIVYIPEGIMVIRLSSKPNGCSSLSQWIFSKLEEVGKAQFKYAICPG